MIKNDIYTIIRIWLTYKDCIGVGTEYVVINGVIVAKFWNGNLTTQYMTNVLNPNVVGQRTII